MRNKKFLIFASLLRLSDWKKAVSYYRKKILDGLELRLDAFSPIDLVRLHRLVSETRRTPPLLVTVRSQKEGGLQDLTLRERKNRFLLFLPYASSWDCELGSQDLLSWLKRTARGRKAGIISYHHFKTTPDLRELEKILKKALRHRPAFTKIAVTARTSKDLLVLLAFLKKYRSKNLIVIAMGKKGESSRTLFPLLGSRITFGHLGFQAAPGQIPIPILYKRLHKIG